MKKVIVLFICVCGIFLSACNYNVVDLQYNYDYAIIQLQNGEVVEGELQSWRDYEDGDQLQLTIDGKTYLVHANNCTLIAYNAQY